MQRAILLLPARNASQDLKSMKPSVCKNVAWASTANLLLNVELATVLTVSRVIRLACASCAFPDIRFGKVLRHRDTRSVM